MIWDCTVINFLVATAVAQTVNSFVQKNLVFKSNATFGNAVPKYMILTIILVVMSAALPAAFSQKNKQGIVLKAGQRDDEGEEL